MLKKLTRQQFSEKVYGKECRLDIWTFVSTLGQQEPPVTQFTTNEVLAGVNHDFPRSIVRNELEAMVDLDLVTRVEGSRPLQYAVNTSSRIGELTWALHASLEEHYQVTFGQSGDPSEAD